MAKVSLQHLSHIPGGGKVSTAEPVDDLSLEVEDREFVVFAGAAGCGGRSAVRMIAGLEAGSAGEIFIGGKRVNDLAPRDRDVAMVFRNEALYPDMTAFENMAYGLKLRKLPKAEIKKRVEEAAGILEMGALLERKPNTLSAGERQRVALGRAIARQPKLFLFDEPLANLDELTRARMRSEIARLHQRLQATIIYATADGEEAMSMGGRVAVMKEGRVQQADAPSRLYREPENLFVAGFLGRPPMNFIHGKLRDAGGGALVFKEAQGGVMELKLRDRPEAAAFAGREVIAGIRPEAVAVSAAPRGAAAGMRFPSLVDLVEPLGAETNVHLQTGAHTLVCRTAEPVSHDDAGHRMQFEVDPAQVHLFDPGTGRRLAS